MRDKPLAAILLSAFAAIPFSPGADAKNSVVFTQVASIRTAGDSTMQPGVICKTTLGLNPANADYDACERTLLRYQPGLSRAQRTAECAEGVYRFGAS